MRLNRRLKWFDKVLIISLLFSVVLPIVGAVSNSVVMAVNNGMPVAFTGYEQSTKHHLMTEKTKLPFLADIFLVDFPVVNVAKWTPLNYWANSVYYPVEGGKNAISIGDIFMWFGTALTMLVLPFILLRLGYLIITRRK